MTFYSSRIFPSVLLKVSIPLLLIFKFQNLTYETFFYNANFSHLYNTGALLEKPAVQ